MLGKFLVLCRADRKENGDKGEYELATRRTFEDFDKAAGNAALISSSREPMVVLVVQFTKEGTES